MYICDDLIKDRKFILNIYDHQHIFEVNPWRLCMLQLKVKLSLRHLHTRIRFAFAKGIVLLDVVVILR